MRTNSNGDEIISDNDRISFTYVIATGDVLIDNEGLTANRYAQTMIPYQEFIEMANEIIRLKEDADAREN